MSQLAFFPWWCSEEVVEVGDYRLIPFSRDREFEDAELGETIGAVLEPYLGSGGHPIASATVASVAARRSTDDMSEEVRQELFTFSELVTIAALAGRQYFSNVGYCNSDNLEFVVQSFNDPTGGAGIWSRRRDGSQTDFVVREVYQVRCPWHVSSVTIEPDVSLLQALLRAQDHEEWPRLYQAVAEFNVANTDRPGMPPEVETVLSIAAIEQLVACLCRNRRPLAALFSSIVVPSANCPREDWVIASDDEGVTARARRAPSLRYAWLEDFAAARGNVAHGHDQDAYPSVWSIREHLLFASFVVPILLKRVLSELGLYEFTQDDQFDLDTFEFLLNERHFEPTDRYADFPWQTVRLRRRIHQRAAEVADMLFEVPDNPGAG